MQILQDSPENTEIIIFYLYKEIQRAQKKPILKEVCQDLGVDFIEVGKNEG